MSKFGAWISGKGIVMLDRNKKVDQDKLNEAQRDKVETLKRLRARVVGYSASRNVFRVIDDEIQKADPNYKPNYSARARKAVVVERNELVQKLRTDLATANALLDWILTEMKKAQASWCGTKGCECCVCRTIQKIEQHRGKNG